MANFVIKINQNQQKSAFFAGRSLLSTRNPDAQIAKYMSEQEIDKHDTVLLLAPPFQYMQAWLSHQRQDFFVVFPEYNEIFDNANLASSKKTWTGGKDLSIGVFLESILDEHNFKKLKIIEWSPISSLYHNFRTDFLAAIKSTIFGIQQNIATQSFFGGRWNSNTVLNIKFIENIRSPARSQGVCLLAASGPSLQRSLGEIQRFRERVVLAALPSSLDFLTSNNIVPDLVFSSDGGYYADIHLRGFLQRTKRNKKQPVFVAPFRANLRPFFGSNSSVCLTSTDTPLENSILDCNEYKSDFAVLPDRGTVAASAIDYLLAFHKGPILLAGLDLANYDLSMHIEPHTYSYTHFFEQERTTPCFDSKIKELYWSRVWNIEKWWRNPALQRYFEWFRMQSTSNLSYQHNVFCHKVESLEDQLSFSCFVPAKIQELLSTFTIPVNRVTEGVKIPRTCFDSYLKKYDNVKI